jgi:hypothetical protein
MAKWLFCGFSQSTSRANLYPVAKQAVDFLVHVIQAFVLIPGGSVEFVQGFIDQRWFDLLLFQEGAQQCLFNIAVIGMVFKVAEIDIS